MIEIQPFHLKSFKTTVPGSKSYSNRALLLASLAKGESILNNVLKSDDTRVMLEALRLLGAKISEKDGQLKIIGTGGKFNDPEEQIYLGNAGTAVRTLTAALALQKFRCTITGNKRMQERPIKDLTDALSNLGAEITTNNGCPPIQFKKPITGGHTTIRGNISSQYLSALLIASPLATNPINIEVVGELTSLPYIDMTLEVMKNFGVDIKHENYKKFLITPSKYQPTNYEIEADASSATYPLALAAIHGISVTISNLAPSSKQADIRFMDVLATMGCKIIKNDESISVTGPKELSPLGEIDLNTLPDAAMTVAIVCAFAPGKSKLTGLYNLRLKETDRLSALATELTKLGVKVKEDRSSITIKGDPSEIHGGIINTYDDHRMAMCFAVAGSKIQNVKIMNPDCVSKTYPNFWKDFKKWGVKTRQVSKKKNIVLCGLRGSGKSTTGKLLAKKLNYDFIDTDKLIEQKNRSPIANIVKERGWDYFREQEAIVAKELEKVSSTVIATGGGMFTNPDNIDSLKKSGIIALLKGDPAYLAGNIEGDKNRPPLTNQLNMTDELNQLWQERKHNYFIAADLSCTIDNKTNNKDLLTTLSQHIDLILDA